MLKGGVIMDVTTPEQARIAEEAGACAVMALDTDAIPYGVPVVSMGGSSFGVDTAVIITPAYSADILDTRIHEILCKPGLYEKV